MRYVVTLLLVVGVASAALNGKYARTPVFDEPKVAVPAGHHNTKGGGGLRFILPDVMYVDSALNQYTFFTTVQDPIAVAPGGDTVLFAFRRYGDGTLGSGALGLVWTVNGGVSFDYIDWPMNGQWPNDPNGEAYLGRYPTAVYHPYYPTISWPELTPGPDWGAVGVASEFGYDLTGLQSGVYSNDIDVHKANGITILDENSDYYLKVLGVASDVNDNVYMWVYDPETYTFVVEPQLIPQALGFDLSAIDYDYVAADRICLFGYHTGYERLAYIYTDVFGTWWRAPMFMPDSLIPIEVVNTPLGPDTLIYTVWWDRDGVVLGDGTPVMITGLTGDLTYNYYGPYSRSIWFLTPDTAVEVVHPTPEMIIYNSQLSYDPVSGKLAVVWMGTDNVRMLFTANGDTLGWGMFDVYVSYSDDGGMTWTDPINLTNTPDINEGLVQISRRLIPTEDGSILWYAYARARSIDFVSAPDSLDLWYNIHFDTPTGGLSDIYIELAKTFLPSVSEDGDVARPVASFVRAFGNTLEFSLPHDGFASVKIYDVSGKLVKDFSGNYAGGLNRLNLSSLGSGVYLAKVVAGDLNETAKVVVVK